MPLRYTSRTRYLSWSIDGMTWSPYFEATDLTADEVDLISETVNDAVWERYGQHGDVTPELRIEPSIEENASRFLLSQRAWSQLINNAPRSLDPTTEELLDYAASFAEQLRRARHQQTRKYFPTVDYGSGRGSVYYYLDSLTNDECEALFSVLAEAIHERRGILDAIAADEEPEDPASLVRAKMDWNTFAECLDNGEADPYEAERGLTQRAIEAILEIRALPSRFTTKSEPDASQISGERSLAASKPSWDRELSELNVDGARVRIRPSAKNLIPILDAFEEESWPPRILDPLPNGPNGERLRLPIRQLNQRKGPIQFEADGRGEGVTWKWRSLGAANSEACLPSCSRASP